MPTITSTVSVELLRDLLHALEGICDEAQLRGFLSYAGISPDLVRRHHSRITHEQLVRFYQIAATQTGDEMMGLWSRPVRRGALKVICQSVRDADSVAVALYRFTQVWNLMLDDYELQMLPAGGPFGLELRRRPAAPLPAAAATEQSPSGGPEIADNAIPVNRFGHMLMLKLAHGVVSWLVGHEVALRRVGFAFPRPVFAEDYRFLFPVHVEYDAPCSVLHFEPELAAQRFKRPYSDLKPFLQRAPRDWIFTTYREHALSMKLREHLSQAGRLNSSLKEAAAAFHMSPRTLMRRLTAEDTSFQGIKDALRRDYAISELLNTDKSLEHIAHDHGFTSVSVFHRAFKRWTGNTPGEYRRGRSSGGP